jgi:hypothetical protein
MEEYLEGKTARFNSQSHQKANKSEGVERTCVPCSQKGGATENQPSWLPSDSGGYMLKVSTWSTVERLQEPVHCLAEFVLLPTRESDALSARRVR